MSCRWEGRPKSPPLSWDGAGSEAVVPPSAWLEELNLAAEGLAKLQEQSEQQDSEPSLGRVKEVLLQHAGTGNAAWQSYNAEHARGWATSLTQMLPQLALLCQWLLL